MSRPAKHIKAHIYSRRAGSTSGILTYHGAYDVVHVVVPDVFNYMRFLSDGSIVLTVEAGAEFERQAIDEVERLIIK